MFSLNHIVYLVPGKYFLSYVLTQGRSGDKGQKGEHGSPGFDVFAAVKVITSSIFIYSSQVLLFLKKCLNR